MIHLGIDPGIAGAIAAIHPTLEIEIFDMPLLPKVGRFNQHDRGRLAAILGQYSETQAIAAVEIVRFDSRDTDHKTSAEWLIRTHESVSTILEVLRIPTLQLEVPQWRRAIGFTGGSDKELARSMAKKYYPQASKLLLKSKTGRSDALLLAHASRVLQQQRAA